MSNTPRAADADTAHVPMEDRCRILGVLTHHSIHGWVVAARAQRLVAQLAERDGVGRQVEGLGAVPLLRFLVATILAATITTAAAAAAAMAAAFRRRLTAATTAVLWRGRG